MAIAHADAGPVVRLIGGPSISCGEQDHPVPEGSKRLLAFVALRRGRIERPYAAGALWPDGDDVRAAGNLRSALWRLRRSCPEVIDADKWSLRLADRVLVDVHELSSWAGRLIHGSAQLADLTASTVPPTACSLLSGWYDDWVIIERERLRQRLLHAFEALCALLIEAGRFADAVDVAQRAVSEEPLRETAQRALIIAYQAQGNDVQARMAYFAFAQLVHRRLGVQPSPQLGAMVGVEPAAEQLLVSGRRA